MFFSIRPETPRVAFVRIFTATTLALALFLAVRAPASAAPICATHKEVTEQLASGFSEVPIAIALTSEGNVPRHLGGAAYRALRLRASCSRRAVTHDRGRAK